MTATSIRQLRTDPDRFAHGTRARYALKCRCDACRAANTAYERARSAARKVGDWNGLVPAAKARRHLLKLSDQGVGRRAVAAATDIADSVLQQIRAGAKQKIRAQTERRILQCNPSIASDGALVPANRTWSKVEWLLEEGFTKAKVSALLGNNGKALQLSRNQVTVRTAQKVDVLFRRYQG